MHCNSRVRNSLSPRKMQALQAVSPTQAAERRSTAQRSSSPILRRNDNLSCRIAKQGKVGRPTNNNRLRPFITTWLHMHACTPQISVRSSEACCRRFRAAQSLSRYHEIKVVGLHDRDRSPCDQTRRTRRVRRMASRKRGSHADDIPGKRQV